MGQTQGFGNGPSTLKIRFFPQNPYTWGSYHNVYNSARIIPRVLPAPYPPRQGVVLTCLKNSSLGEKLVVLALCWIETSRGMTT